MSEGKLILASSSPRRQELLRSLLREFEVRPCALGEPQYRPGRVGPAGWAQALAYYKARAVAEAHRGCWVLGADTIVVCARRVLGKPKDLRDARRMLYLQAGRESQVLTAVALVRLTGSVRRVFGVARSTVRMRADRAGIEEYLRSGDWQGKAGAYGIQDCADRLVECVQGSFWNVVGLPLELVRQMLEAVGLLEAG